MNDEYKTAQSIRLLINQIIELIPDNISELLLARYDLTRELKCASKEDRKFLIEQIDKLDTLILKLKGMV